MTCLQAAVEFILELQLDDEPDPTPSAPHTHTHTMSNAETQSPSRVVLNSGPDSDSSENNSENENENTDKGSFEGCGMAGDASRSHRLEANCAATTSPVSYSSPSSLAASSANTSSVVRMQVQDPNMSQHSDLGRDRDREQKRDKDCTAVCADREGDGNRSLKPPRDDGYAAVIKLGEM
jgi:hypothetical protein